MTTRRETRAQLSRIGGLADDAIDPAATALLLAQLERPRASLEPYRRHLQRLVDEVAAYAGKSPALERRAEALVQVLCRRYGYGPGEEAEPAPATLMEAIDRRCGVPAALAILYLHVAAKQGWGAAALDFPSRVLIRLEAEGRRLIVDPYAGGRSLRPEDLRALLKAHAGLQAELGFEHHRPLGGRALLLRLHAKLKVRLLRAERLEDALGAVEAMLLIAPDAHDLWREAGLIHARLDNVKAAVAALEEYMRRTGAESSRYSTSVLLQQLRGRLN